MDASIKHFLLVFDHGQDKLVDVVEFGTNIKAAMARYDQLEKECRSNHAIDIVLVGSDSIETVKVTHSNYFDGMSKSRIHHALDLLNI